MLISALGNGVLVRESAWVVTTWKVVVCAGDGLGGDVLGAFEVVGAGVVDVVEVVGAGVMRVAAGVVVDVVEVVGAGGMRPR